MEYGKHKQSNPFFILLTLTLEDTSQKCCWNWCIFDAKWVCASLARAKIKLLKAANCPGSKTGIFERKGAMIQEISVDEKSYSDNDAEITQLIENEENEQHDRFSFLGCRVSCCV